MPPTAQQQRDPYEVLDVPRSASQDEIKKAFQKAARKHHPDVNPGNREEAEKAFKEIAQAYEILSDPEKRQAFDQFGFAGVGATGAGGAGSPFDFSNFQGGGFEDLFDAFFGGGRGQRRRGGPQPGADLQVVVNITLEEVMEGTTKEVKYNRDLLCDTCRGSGAAEGTSPVSCPECGGVGQVSFTRGGFLRISQPCPRCSGRGTIVQEACRTCHGRGTLNKPEVLTVKVPPGVSSNTQIRLDGKGEAGAFGGPPGDLYVLTRIQDHKLFERRGDNLYVEVPITITEAALGARIEVPALKGKERTTFIKIPPGTQTGTQFRLRGYGIPRLNGRGQGDEYVVVSVHTPANLSTREKQLLKDLDSERKESPRDRLLVEARK